MNTTTSVKLIYSSPLWLMSNSYHHLHDSYNLSDTKELEVCPHCEQNVDIEYLDQEYKCHSCGEVFTKHLKKKEIGYDDLKLIKNIDLKNEDGIIFDNSFLVFKIDCSKIILDELLKYTEFQHIVYRPIEFTSDELKNEKQLSPDSFKFSIQISLSIKNLINLFNSELNNYPEFKNIIPKIINELPYDYQFLISKLRKK